MNAWAGYLPTLRHLRISGTQIGTTAASMLMQRIEQADVLPATVDAGFELIERESA